METKNKNNVRELFGKPYELVDSIKIKRGDQWYRNSYWREVGASGTEAKLDTFTIECRIPTGYEDIDPMHLSEACIKPGYVIDEHILR